MTTLIHALDLLKAGGFRTGPEFDEAHEICQSQEGDPCHDWVHALCHRVEGDDFNANYWYKRAGRERHSGSIEEEWQIIRDSLAQE